MPATIRAESKSSVMAWLVQRFIRGVVFDHACRFGWSLYIYLRLKQQFRHRPARLRRDNRTFRHEIMSTRASTVQSYTGSADHSWRRSTGMPTRPPKSYAPRWAGSMTSKRSSSDPYIRWLPGQNEFRHPPFDLTPRAEVPTPISGFHRRAQFR